MTWSGWVVPLCVLTGAAACRKGEETPGGREGSPSTQGSASASEAKSNLAKIAALAEEYLAKSSEVMTSATITTGVVEAPVARYPHAPPCVKDPDGEFRRNGQQVPAEPRAVQGIRYEPSETDWMPAGADTPTAWQQMHFAITQPIRFGYCYEGSGTGVDSRFTAWAVADVDGDGVWATYVRAGMVDPDGRPIIGPVAVFNEGE